MTPKTKKPQLAAAHAAQGYEFGGPLGAAAITFGLPLLLYIFTFACNDVTGCPATALLSPRSLTAEELKYGIGWPGFSGLASWEATGWTLAYYLLSALLYRILPATETEGTELLSGGRLKYRFNAFSSSIFTLVVSLAGSMARGAEFVLWTFIADNYVQILTANILISYTIALFVYVRSFSVKPRNSELRELAAGGHTGNIVYDFYMGRELNPRITVPLIGEIDLKEFLELRPGMLGWILLNCAFVAKQYRNFGYVTDSIVFVTIVQAIYVLDGQYMEPAILTTMDITTDGFGFMLAFGDLAWLPFIYSQQTRYLSTHPVSMGAWGTVGVVAVLAVGYSIFRLSNSQKDMFRTDPDDPRVADLSYIKTRNGSRLITSGWWGVSRHINYFGDWLQSWPYSLPTGLSGYVIETAGSGLPAAYKMLDGREVVQGVAKGWGMLFTYFYILYFAVLLVHRAGRDDEKCARKYGEDWDKYKSMVKWRIIPGLY